METKKNIRQKNEWLSVASLWLGVSSIFFGFLIIPPILAIIFGIVGLQREYPNSKWKSVTGIILGIVFLYVGFMM